MNTDHLSRLLGERIIRIEQISGGCIGNSVFAESQNRKKYFVKRYYDNKPGRTLCEAEGLKELANTKVIRVPEVFLVQEDYIVLEFIESGQKVSGFMQNFGRALGELHKHVHKYFGFRVDNFIGKTFQSNSQSEDWLNFYREERLMYQFRLLEQKGYADAVIRRSFSKLLDKLDSIIISEDTTPSLIHGDLWSGNYMIDNYSNPVLIDPAAYYGDREADIAMTRLFGGFDDDFYSAYNENYAMALGYDYREKIYKLYHLLNHLNIFGYGYYSQVLSTMEFYL